MMYDGERTSGRLGDEAAQEGDTYLPPRRTVHPSEKGVWTRRFYLVLLWLFIILTATLLVWGYRADAIQSLPSPQLPAALRICMIDL